MLSISTLIELTLLLTVADASSNLSYAQPSVRLPRFG